MGGKKDEDGSSSSLSRPFKRADGRITVATRNSLATAATPEGRQRNISRLQKVCEHVAWAVCFDEFGLNPIVVVFGVVEHPVRFPAAGPVWRAR